MGHGLQAGQDTMFSVREVPWHKLGIVLNAAPTIAEGIKLAGMDWAVEKRAIFLADGVKIDGYFATVKVPGDQPLGIVGEDYEPLQNATAFQCLDPLIQAGEVALETAGTLFGGKIIWVLAKFGQPYEVAPGDVVKDYLLLTTAHDSTRRVWLRDLTTRVVCNNTLSAALMEIKDAEKLSAKTLVKKARLGKNAAFGSRKHVGQVNEDVMDAGKLLHRMIQTREVMKELYTRMASTEVQESTMRNLLKLLVPDNEEAQSHTRTENIRSSIWDCIQHSPGADLGKGTAWGWLNGATYYADHAKLTRRSDESKLASSWFGDTARFKARALELVAEILDNGGIQVEAAVEAVQAATKGPSEVAVPAPAGVPLAALGM